MPIDKSRWQRIEPVLDGLLECAADERATELSKLRDNDPELAADVESLLAQEAAVERAAFLEGSALPGESLAGQVIGSYTLERPLGQGGMGSVWLAHRSDGRFEGQAAIKFLNLALVSRGGAQRFHREGNVLARLSHPNIARLLDAGVAPGGQPYLVLEVIDGEPIDRWCAIHGSTVEARVRLFLQVLAAVGFAHENLILHRDLKPANILVTRQGVVKLLDFGIAKLLDASERIGPATELTQLAGRAFTPEYAAPEQIQGGDVSTATDVYALGVLLFQLLSGRHPTASPASSPVDRLRAVLETVPTRLSQAAAHTIESGATASASGAALPPRVLRGDLDNIVAKALKKLPRERYASVTAFAGDLEHYLANEPITARADSRRYRLGKFVQRHRLGVGAASAIVLALVAGVIGTTWQAIEARRERDEALFQAERARARSSLVNLMLGAMGAADHPLTQREILERSLALVERQFTKDPRIAVELLLPIAGQYMTIGDTAREYAVMQRAGRLAQDSGDPGLIADVACSTVETELIRDRVDLARIELAKGLEALSRVTRFDLGTVLECMQADSNLALSEGDFDRSIARISEAVERAERADFTHGTGYPKVLSFLGKVQQISGDLAGSFRTQEKLRTLDERMGRVDTADYLGERRNEAVLLGLRGEFVASRALLETIIQRWMSVTGETAIPPYVKQVRGVVLHRLGELEAARRDLTDAAAGSRALGTIGRAYAADLALARVLAELGRHAEARALLDSVETARAGHEVRPGLVASGLVNAELLLAQGETGQALQDVEDELATMGFPSAKPSPALATALRLAARAALASGDAERSERWATHALAVAQALARDAANSGDVGEALLILAHAQRSLGRDVDATASAKRAVPSLAAGLGNEHRLTREARAFAQR